MMRPWQHLYRSFRIFGVVGMLALALSAPASAADLLKALPKPYAAPEIAGIEHWINSEPLSIAKLKGKVVLVDFWTYSCVNCVRTLPYITSWDAKYRDKGLVIVGVSAPEFAFERDLKNVRMAIAKYGIHYPVALDNDMVTWNNYKNRYWPAHYLINREGQVVYTHFGEGEYDTTEQNIRTLLGIADIADAPTKPATTFTTGQTPETYLGLARRTHFVSDSAAALPLHHWSLSGAWQSTAQNITSGKAGDSLTLHFNARKAYLVLGTASGSPVTLHVTLNGVAQKPITVTMHQLYELADQQTAKEGTLTLTADAPGLEAYAFTFGN